MQFLKNNFSLIVFVFTCGILLFAGSIILFQTFSAKAEDGVIPVDYKETWTATSGVYSGLGGRFYGGYQSLFPAYQSGIPASNTSCSTLTSSGAYAAEYYPGSVAISCLFTVTGWSVSGTIGK